MDFNLMLILDKSKKPLKNDVLRSFLQEKRLSYAFFRRFKNGKSFHFQIKKVTKRKKEFHNIINKIKEVQVSKLP